MNAFIFLFFFRFTFLCDVLLSRCDWVWAMIESITFYRLQIQKGSPISLNRSLLNIDNDYNHFVSLILSAIAYLSRAMIALTIQWLNDWDDVQNNKEIIIESFIELSICNVKNRSIVCHNIVRWALFCLMHIAHSGSKNNTFQITQSINRLVDLISDRMKNKYNCLKHQPMVRSH